MVDLISVRGAVDLHCHPYPDLFPRIADDIAVVEHARQMGLRAILLKCHVESTVSRAYLLRKFIPGIEVFGGVVLNTYVGGLNPAAVEACLRLGGKEVWMPTIDAWYHGQVHGRTGAYDVQSGGRNAGPGITVLDEVGKLKSEVYEILDLIAKYDVILGTCHLSPTEIYVLVREACSRGVRKILITHPFFKVPRLSLDQLEELVKMGAYAEFGYCTVSPMWGYATIGQKVEAIKRLGASRCVLMSDTGQRHNPMPAEALRIFAQCLYEAGIAEDEIYTMIVRNPAELLGLEPTEAESRIEPKAVQANP